MKMRDRSTGDLLVLMIAGTVCTAVLAGGAAIAVVEIFRPDTDTAKAVNAIRDVIGTLLGLVSGFLAGTRVRASLPGGDDELDGQGRHL